jgi:transcriptional regulator GlxA family with amidase domain
LPAYHGVPAKLQHFQIECLETDFANDLSIDELAVQAQMSRSHFALTFQCTQNKDHKDCQKPPFLYEQD